ncbi:MAG: hypothetical protein HY695_08590 [Deltaproteobacteria bacterium]|nr:hypothetical protein [Deltaproteobacteria bacterium]
MNLPGNQLRLALRSSLLLLIWAIAASAAEKTPIAVQFKIGTILASNQTEEFDPRLTKMKNQLEVIKYRSYRLMQEQAQTVPWHTSAVFEIPGGRFLVVVPEEFRNQRLSVKVRLLEGEKPLLDTTVRLRNKGNFLLGGPAHEGGVLILSISAMTQ